MSVRSSWVAAVVALAAGTAQCVCAASGPALTTIEDRLYRADGSRFTGVLYIEWRSFETSSSTYIPAQTITARIADGMLRVKLVPTTTATPRAYYRVRYSSDGRSDFYEYWSVPPSNVAQRVKDIRIPGPLSVSATNPMPPINTAILLTDVAGLRDELDLRPMRGDGFIPGRVAVVNADGALESVTGGSADCVHVDGSSGPCGGGGVGVAFVDAETPSGVVDGTNATFALAATPQTSASVMLYRNGVLLRAGVDFTLSDRTLTLLPGAVPQGGDTMQAWYRVASPNAGPVQFIDGETPAGTIDGTNRSFTLASTPTPDSSLQLYRNGILLKAGLDYDLAGNLVTFRDGAVPEQSDTLAASYRK